jgi:hypothetical protein
MMNLPNEREFLVRINSEERIGPLTSPSSNFAVTFPNATQIMSIGRTVIKTISIPNVQYNVRPALGLNPIGNVFSYDNGAPQSITITPGYYNINTLMSAIMADAQAIADGLTLSLDPVTLHVLFSSVTPISYFNITSGNNIAPILGITADSAPLVLAFTAQGLPNLATHPCLYIASQTLSDGNNMLSPTLSMIPVVAVVPINVQFGDIISYVTQEEHLDDVHYPSVSNGKTLQKVDLRVYDGDANLVDLQGLDWTIVFKVYAVPK